LLILGSFDLFYSFFFDLGPMGFEPITLALSTLHSNQLSYDPNLVGGKREVTIVVKIIAAGDGKQKTLKFGL
jgi:hypothetical protein